MGSTVTSTKHTHTQTHTHFWSLLSEDNVHLLWKSPYRCLREHVLAAYMRATYSEHCLTTIYRTHHTRWSFLFRSLSLTRRAPAAFSLPFFSLAILAGSERGDFNDLVPILLRETLNRLNDDDATVLAANSIALRQITSSVPPEEIVKHIDFSRNLVNSLVSEARRRKGGVGDGLFLLPGINIPKGLEPILPMYHQGILYGTPIVRETAATGLGELIELTSEQYLAGPIVVKMTGPLIRIVGDRNPSSVKVAIVKTLRLILEKAGPALRAFVPQLQTTFVKNLADTSRSVRVEATRALGSLMSLSTRVDPLVVELVAGALGKSASALARGEDGGLTSAGAVQSATFEALAVVIAKAGSKIKDLSALTSALQAGKDLLFDEDEGIREGAGKVVGAAVFFSPIDESCSYLKVLFAKARDASADVRVGACVGIRRAVDGIRSAAAAAAAASGGGEARTFEDLFDEARALMLALIVDSQSAVKESAGRAIGALVTNKKSLKTLEASILKAMSTTETGEVQKAVCRGLSAAAKRDSSFLKGKAGVTVVSAAIELSRNGDSRVMFCANTLLCYAFDVLTHGDDDKNPALVEFCALAGGETGRLAREIVRKVIGKYTAADLDEEDF